MRIGRRRVPKTMPTDTPIPPGLVRTHPATAAGTISPGTSLFQFRGGASIAPVSSGSQRAVAPRLAASARSAARRPAAVRPLDPDDAVLEIFSLPDGRPRLDLVDDERAGGEGFGPVSRGGRHDDA